MEHAQPSPQTAGTVPMMAQWRAQATTMQMQGQLHSLLQAIEAGFPAMEVLHSLHTQAETDPAVKAMPAMQRFSEAGLRNVHATVAAAGYVRRMLAGDSGADVLAGLRRQLEEMRATHQEAKSSLARVMGAPPAHENRALQSMNQVFQLVDQHVKQMAPLVTALAAEAPAAPPVDNR